MGLENRWDMGNVLYGMVYVLETHFGQSWPAACGVFVGGVAHAVNNVAHYACLVSVSKPDHWALAVYRTADHKCVFFDGKYGDMAVNMEETGTGTYPFH